MEMEEKLEKNAVKGSSQNKEKVVNETKRRKTQWKQKKETGKQNEKRKPEREQLQERKRKNQKKKKLIEDKWKNNQNIQQQEGDKSEQIVKLKQVRDKVTRKKRNNLEEN